MTKVLGKSFAILEAVVEASPLPITLMELSKLLKMNKATCSRLARELMEMGYLEQRSRMGGFMAGPKAWSLGKHVRYAEDLITAAETPISAWAEALKQSVMLVILRKGLRYVLVHRNSNSEGLRIDLRKIALADAFNTATGLVLLAYSGEEEYQAALALRVEELSFRWNERGGDAAKDAIFSKIREDAMLIHESSSRAYPSAIACPVFKKGAFAAAVGVSMPRDLLLEPGQREFFSKEMRALSKAISNNLSQNNSL
jgi:DNA-binding IclR family transcriptional regulator